MPPNTFKSSSLLQHALKTLAQDAFNLADPGRRLPLNILVIVLLQLTDEWQHLGQESEPVLSELLGQRLLALDCCQSGQFIVVSHELENGRVERFVMFGGRSGPCQPGDGGDNVKRISDFRLVGESHLV